MMKIQLICVGQKMPQWISQGFQEYNKRLSSHLKLELVEIALPHRGKNADIQRLKEEEGEKKKMKCNLSLKCKKSCHKEVLTVQIKIGNLAFATEKTEPLIYFVYKKNSCDC